MDKILLQIGCLVFVMLGCMHVAIAFLTTKFEPADKKLLSQMKQTNPIITNQTTIWDASQGFHTSHSLGAIFFGMIYIVLTIENYNYLKSSVLLNSLLLLFPLTFLLLAIKFWFKKPAIATAIALSLIICSLVLRQF